MLSELACIAMLLNLPMPTTLPKVHEFPMYVIHAACGSRANGCFYNGNIYLPEGRIRNDTRVHELAHHVQWSAGLDMSDYRVETGAKFVEQTFNAFCGSTHG